MTAFDIPAGNADSVQDLLDTAVDVAPQWGDDAPRGARTVLSRIIKAHQTSYRV